MTASASDIKAGRASIEIAISDKLQAGLAEASAKLRAFGAGVATIGAGITAVGAAFAGPILASAKAFSSAGDDIEKMARRTGMAAEAVSELKFAAAQSGTEINAVEIAIKKMQKTITDASDGTKEASDSLKYLGLTVKDLRGLSPEDQFAMIAKKIADIEDPTTKAARAVDLFGKSGTAIIPLIEDFDALKKEARELGIVMSTEDAKAAAELNDAFGRLTAQFESIKNIVGAAVTPLLLDMAESLKETAKSVIAWVDNNRELMQSILKLTGIIAALGTVITTVGVAIIGLGVTIGSLKTVLPVFALMKTGIMSIVPAVGAMSAAFAAASLGVFRLARDLTFAVLAMTGLSTATIATIASVSGFLAVAGAGFYLGKMIGEIDAVKRSLDALLGVFYRVKEVTNQELFDINLKQLNTQMERGKLTAEEYERSLAKLYEMKKGNIIIDVKADEKKTTAVKSEESIAFEKKSIRDLEDFKVGLINDRYAREMAMIELKYNREIEEARSVNADVAAINEKRILEETAIAEKLDGDMQSFKKASAARYSNIHQSLIEDDLDRELYAIRTKYQAEIDAANGVSDVENTLNDLQRKEAEAAIELDRRRRDEAAKTVNKSNEMDIADLALRAAYKGYELEKKRLELARERALTDAKSSGASVDLINRRFDLEKQILDAAENAKNNTMSVAGAFNAVEAAGIAAGTSKEAERTAKATEKTVDILRKIEKKTGVPVSIVS